MGEAIKAIETEYAGHRFRSRLEARWAVFFDSLGARWTYEPQGYEVADGVRYLPDFWLPDSGIWVEVKGTLDDSDAVQLIAAADRDGLPYVHEKPERPGDLIDGGDSRWYLTGMLPRVLILGEVPPPSPYAWLHRMLFLTCGVVTVQTALLWANGNVLGFTPIGYLGHAVALRQRPIAGQANTLVLPHPRIADAYGAARKARFEHGEAGYMKPALKHPWPEPARPGGATS
jgi:hypothetical protein